MDTIIRSQLNNTHHTMISIITDTPPTPPEIKFPCLMESLSSERIVLFTNPTTGTIMSAKDLGFHLDTWNYATDAKNWKPFLGILTLKND